MKESKKQKKLRVYDQWFYQVEDSGRVIYNTTGKEKPKKKKYMKLIIDENLAIIEWWKGKENTRILIINKQKNTCIYQETCPSIIYVEKIPKNDICINYFEDLKDVKKPGRFTFEFPPSKKRKKDFNPTVENVESKQKEYVEELIKYIKTHRDLIEYDSTNKKESNNNNSNNSNDSNVVLEEENTSPIVESTDNIINLKLPESIFLVDREYKFVKCTPSKYTYEYKDINEVRVAEISNHNNLYDINIVFKRFVKDKSGKKCALNKYALSIGYDVDFRVEFGTLDKSDIVLDTPTIIHVDEKKRKSTQTALKGAKFWKKTTYGQDPNSRAVSSSVVIETEKEQYVLESEHTRYYLDENNVSYYITGSEYGMLDNIANVAPFVYNNIAETFSKVKQK